jgi:hypothetical protein
MKAQPEWVPLAGISAAPAQVRTRGSPNTSHLAGVPIFVTRDSSGSYIQR